MIGVVFGNCNLSSAVSGAAAMNATLEALGEELDVNESFNDTLEWRDYGELDASLETLRNLRWPIIALFVVIAALAFGEAPCLRGEKTQMWDKDCSNILRLIALGVGFLETLIATVSAICSFWLGRQLDRGGAGVLVSTWSGPSLIVVFVLAGVSLIAIVCAACLWSKKNWGIQAVLMAVIATVLTVVVSITATRASPANVYHNAEDMLSRLALACETMDAESSRCSGVTNMFPVIQGLTYTSAVLGGVSIEVAIFWLLSLAVTEWPTRTLSCCRGRGGRQVEGGDDDPPVSTAL
jgi:hypothetical protein